LVVATYRRPDMLARCVAAALAQTVRPAEVVVVDASPDWDTARARICGIVAAADPAIPCRYVPATVARLPAQRNQAIDLATADVLFMIDDDSLMFPDCAEQILGVYAADRDQQIAGVGAVDVPGAVPDEPGFRPPPLPAPRDLSGAAADAADDSFFKRLRWRIARLYDRGEQSFIPYDGQWPHPPIPAACQRLSVERCYSFNGFRMTFRREAIARERFVEWFVGSAPLEDIDASYRVSRHGALVQCNTARLAHLRHASGRMNPYAISVMWAINGAILLRLFAPDRPDLARRWRRRVAQSVWLELFKDVVRLRFGLPTFRALWLGRSHIRRAETMQVDELRAWYLQLQQRLLQGVAAGSPPAAQESAAAAVGGAPPA
jgi:GT2 family glycosyltransferase